VFLYFLKSIQNEKNDDSWRGVAPSPNPSKEQQKTEKFKVEIGLLV